jgi:subfamily B ATP-binding cassette protein MsbA
MSSDPQSSKILLRRLLHGYVLRYRKVLLLGMGCMVIMAATTAANAYMMQPVLDDIFVRKDAALLLVIPLIIFSISVVNGVSDYGQSLALRYTGQRIVSDMQSDLFAHLIRADLATFHDTSSGKLLSRMTNDIMLMRQAVSSVLTGFVKESLTAIFLIGVMFYQSWQMACIAFGVLIFAVLPILRLGRRMRKVSHDTQARLGDFNGQLDETFMAAKMVKAYSREDYEITRVNASIRALFKLYYKAARIQVMNGPIMVMLGGIAVALIIWSGGYKVVHGTTTPGAFFSFLTAMLMAYRPVKALSGLNSQLQEGLAAAQRFYAMMDLAPTITDAADALPLVIEKGDITFADVSFRYQNESAGIFNLSLLVPAGKTVALVGPSGAGKTTLMHLLLRLYEPQQGTIRIDGQHIREVTLASLREQVGLVSQDVSLFDDTVRANIAYGKLDATDAEIIEAAQQAHAHAFIMQLPQGYDTPIGAHGVKLSGGQRQRLSIARALLKNAPILLLDEATSALDTASERAVQEALDTLMQHRTTLVIAHRLSTIQHADHIVVLEAGRIVEQGTHDVLLAKQGLYASLYHQQFAPSTVGDA